MELASAGDRRWQAVLEPKRLIRWVYVARLSLAWAIIIAAIASWRNSDNEKTLVATLAFIIAHFVTIASFAWSDIRQHPLTRGFFYLQAAADVALVTSVVHVTDGQFAALYILVNAVAAIVLPFGGALLVTALGLVLYTGDVVMLQALPQDSVALALQLIVFSLSGVGASYIAVQLKAAGVGAAAELYRVQLRDADILRNIRSGIMSVSRGGELLFANPAAGALLGLDLSERIGSPILAELDRIAPGLAAAIRRAADDGSGGGGRTEGILRRGSVTVPLGVTTTSTDTGDGAAERTITAIFQDISDQKRLEQLHLRAERLEAVAELSASLAHEIKNPLASIRSAVEQLSARRAATDDERTLGNLIVRESDRLSRLLSEFLDFARVRVTRRDPVDVSQVVRGACRLAAEHPSKPGGVTVTAGVADGPAVVDGDEDLLHRVVFNLTLNAVQASPTGAAVEVSVRRVSPGAVPRGVTSLERGAIAIVVHDDGPGIDATLRDRLFEPFATTKQGGSGLGLPIAYRAVEAHGGVVLVDTGDHGTTFTVMLPVHASMPGGGSA